MTTSIQFLGAARGVTGSCYLVELGDHRILIDCGLYQERDFKDRNWDNFPVNPSTIDAMILTHGHLDHCGRIPKLVNDGFTGQIYGTGATCDIAGIVMMDSGHIQEEDAAYKAKRHKKEGRKGKFPEVPLYTKEDAENAMQYFVPKRYEEPFEPVPGITVTLHDAGHILGSSHIKMTVPTEDGQKVLVFSGDVGRWDVPILGDPVFIEDADYIQLESTYGDRDHKAEETVEDDLEQAINDTVKRGGKVIIPSFAIERAQELLWRLGKLLRAKKIPQLDVYLDSPMAIKVTEVFLRHPEMFDEETLEMIKRGEHPCDFPGLRMSRKTEESKALNFIKEPCIIIAGSGMCTGGRIKHHIKNNIGNPASTILFVGYQAEGTLGRHILDGAEEIRIHGKMHEVKCEVGRIHGFSAHADRNELLKFLSHVKKEPEMVFVTHGEESQALAFAGLLEKEKGWKTLVPEYKEKYRLK